MGGPSDAAIEERQMYKIPKCSTMYNHQREFRVPTDVDNDADTDADTEVDTVFPRPLQQRYIVLSAFLSNALAIGAEVSSLYSYPSLQPLRLYASRGAEKTYTTFSLDVGKDGEGPVTVCVRSTHKGESTLFATFSEVIDQHFS